MYDAIVVHVSGFCDVECVDRACCECGVWVGLVVFW